VLTGVKAKPKRVEVAELEKVGLQNNERTKQENKKTTKQQNKKTVENHKFTKSNRCNGCYTCEERTCQR
jgi:hypothetical protein